MGRPSVNEVDNQAAGKPGHRSGGEDQLEQHVMIYE